nr:hypothetical protein HKQZZDGK_HKQZZDGK_CDS_0004 [Microvirus sp.]
MQKKSAFPLRLRGGEDDFLVQIMLLFKLGSLVKWCFLFAHTMENSISFYVIFFLHF